MHRIVFQRDLGGREMTLFANGEIDSDLLDELASFVERQRERLIQGVSPMVAPALNPDQPQQG